MSTPTKSISELRAELLAAEQIVTQLREQLDNAIWLDEYDSPRAIASRQMNAHLQPVCDMNSGVWGVSLAVKVDPAGPVIELCREIPYQERYSYSLSTLTECAMTGRPLHFGDAGSEATRHILSPVAVRHLVADAVRRIPAAVGRMHSRWEPNDPRMPF